MAFSAAVVPPASADTGGELQAARQQVEETQRAADELAAKYEATLVKHAEVEYERDVAQDRIADLDKRRVDLQAAVRAFAADVYVGGNDPLGAVTWLDGNDVLGVRRRSYFAQLATEPRNITIDELAAVQEDVELERARLEQAAAETNDLLEALEVEGQSLQAQLAAAQEAQTQLEAQLAREEEQRRAEEARRLALIEEAKRRDERAARSTTTVAPTPATTPTTTSRAGDDPAPTAEPVSSPSTGSLVCPIRGAVSFVDSWGDPRSGGRSHQGVDMMSPNGTPNVAVVSGDVLQKEGNLSGLAVYLSGDDGNSYWYFHLSAFEGPPRRVEQGEVIGYVGSSGNADAAAPHTHFEYHPGGGRATNPYSLVRGVC